METDGRSYIWSELPRLPRSLSPPSQVPQPRHSGGKRRAHTPLDEILRTARATIASGVARSDSLRILSNYDDLSDAEKAIPEQWMEAYIECTRMKDADTPETRRAALDECIKDLWDIAFNRWNSNMTVPLPVSAAKRQAGHTTMAVGTLREDASASAENRARQKQGHAIPAVPEWRRRGATIHLKVNLNWEGNDLTFPFVDVKGASFQASIKYDLAENITIEYAKGLLSTSWDKAELSRLAKANTSLMVYWCRNALLKSLRHEARYPNPRSPMPASAFPSASAPSSADNSATAIPRGRHNPDRTPDQRGVTIDERSPDFSKLAHIELCKDV
ncbi:hypothetical protein COL5a_011077 [Colletotrichum fioriniae]|nr:uncharacterized protein COL516b_010412 [Colletotrichum fioriniae]KAJ0297802.1 hypothetical protein COL516b_010412 [Colletotrichum fioriniae]KAJ0317510.1 hypothetical protein COL5a_011077 [Colletotrichum fioriniae]